MNSHRWVVIVGAILFAAIVGVMAYNAGIAHGIAQSGKMPAFNAPNPYPYPYPYPYYGWHFGGFFFFPFLFIAFWLLVVRGLFWRRGWHGRGCGGYEARFDEWHRQSHERMKEV